MPAASLVNTRPLLAAGTVLGIGMGGFIDGILFHQILQIHNMLSNVVSRDSLINEEIIMFWDGLFHAFTWLVTALAVWMLWHVARRHEGSLLGRSYFGAALAGWGLFNVVEGVIDHQILQLHHVYQNGDHLLWDVVFLVSGVVFILLGWLLSRRGEVPIDYQRSVTKSLHSTWPRRDCMAVEFVMARNYFSGRELDT